MSLTSVYQDRDHLIKFFKALANEERLEIVYLLKTKGELCAQDVEKHFYLEQSTTSHHLNTLKRAGVTRSRKDGRHIFYSVDFDRIEALIAEFKDLILTRSVSKQ
jgi:DNA-binding transcriptional ArsR family regulator